MVHMLSSLDGTDGVDEANLRIKICEKLERKRKRKTVEHKPEKT